MKKDLKNILDLKNKLVRACDDEEYRKALREIEKECGITEKTQRISAGAVPLEEYEKKLEEDDDLG